MSEELIEELVEQVVEVSMPTWTFRYPLNAVLVNVNDILFDNRSREDFGNLEDLAADIMKNGLLHPPTVSPGLPGSGKTYVLIGGERRCRAMALLGITDIPVNTREYLEKHQILELELAENFHRKDMKWQEYCILIHRTHNEKVRVASADAKSWGVRETGALLGVSNAHVSHATKLAPLLISGDDELIGASSMFAAYEILLKRAEDAAMKLATQNLNTTAKRATTAMGIRGTIDDVDGIFNPPASTPGETFGGFESIDAFLNEANNGEAPAPSQKLRLNLNELFVLGDCLTVMPQMPAECVDHIVTDPPYGIDLSLMAEIKNIDTVAATHDRAQNISMFQPFLEQSYRLLKPSGYCAFWYDLDHHNLLQSIAEQVGFKVQRWPLIWNKLHPCLNNAPRVNTTKNFECVMLLRKGKAVLTSPQVTSIFAADGAADRKLYDNPFSKPMAAWSFILNAIAYKGQTIFDPYAGQMSCGRAVINHGMIPSGIEVDVNHYNRGIMNLTQLLRDINGD